MDNTVRLWDLPAGKEIARLEGHRGWVLSVAFSPDGRRLVSGGLDTTALVWDVSRFRHRTAPQATLSATDRDQCLGDLGGDAASGQRALGRLLSSQKDPVKLLRDRVKPAERPAPTRPPPLTHGPTTHPSPTLHTA